MQRSRDSAGPEHVSGESTLTRGQLRQLTAAIARITAARTLHDMLEALGDEARRLLRADRVTVALGREPDDVRVVVGAPPGAPPADAGAARLSAVFRDRQGRQLGWIELTTREPEAFETGDEVLQPLVQTAGAMIDQHRLLEDLQDHMNLVHTLTENTASALFMINREGVPTFMNSAARDITGFSLDEIGTRPLHDSIHHRRPDGSPHPMHECDIGPRLLRLEPFRNHRDTFARRDGSLFPVSCSMTPITRGGGPVGAVLEVCDISEQVQGERERETLLAAERTARAAAEAANRVKDEFLAVLSHELRTPLNAILGWARLLVGQNRAPEMIERAAETIERNARLQTQLVEDLLDVSRIVTGKFRLQFVPVVVQQTIHDALETVRAAAETKGVAIDLLLPEAPLLTLGDCDRLQQIVWNLLANAIKFTPAGGRVVLTAARAGDIAEIVVQDTGAGIEREFLPHVFDRFKQADSSTTRSFGGLGLGLAIVRYLAEAHGGTVVADSAGANQGATFTVRLPRLDGSLAATARVRDAATSKLLENIHVLLVEDNDDTRELMELTLQDAGATVTAAVTVRDAQRAAAATAFPVIVADLGLPDRDGYAFIRQLRASAWPSAGARALAVSAYAREEDRRRSLEAGFDQHLVKPIAPGALVSAIAQALADGERDT